MRTTFLIGRIRRSSAQAVIFRRFTGRLNRRALWWPFVMLLQKEV